MRPGFLVLTAVLVAATAAAQDRSAGGAPAVAVAAGFDGYYTVGRWVPVRVDAENRGADFDGDVRVEWGATIYRQAISLPSPSRKRVEFYVRAADLRDSLRIVLHDARGRLVTAHDVPVRGLLPAEPLHVIAGSPSGAAGGVRVAFVSPADLPASWRGYDGVDDVRIDAATAIQPAQARALDRWRAVRGVDDAGAIRMGIPGAAPENKLDGYRWRFAGLYLAVLAAVLIVVPWLARRPPAAHAAIAGGALAFAATAVVSGPVDSAAGVSAPKAYRLTPAGTYVSALTFAQPAGREVTVVGARVSEALLEPASDAPPHEIRYAEDGSAAFAIAGSAGECFSVIERGFVETASHD